MTTSIISYEGVSPTIADDAFIAFGAVIIGDVTIEAGASIWFNCVLRGDEAPIIVGSGSNIQDGTIVHADPGFPTTIGRDVLIGHHAVIHGCSIAAGGFVGMGAIVLNGAAIEQEAMLAASAMLTGGKTVATRQLWGGQPARYMRDLRECDLAGMRESVEHYRDKARRYRQAAEHSTC
jgi:gamma-carbonic anhydrase